MNREIKLGAILSYCSLFVSIIIGILYTPFMLSHMGTSEYGIFSIALSVISYLNIIDNGFAAGVIRFVSYYRGRGEEDKVQSVISTSLCIYLILAVICLLLGVLLLSNLTALYSEGLSPIELQRLRIIISILIVYIAVLFLSSVVQSVVMAYERFVCIKAVLLLTTVLKPLTMTPLLLLGYKSIAMTIVTVCCGLLASLIYLHYAHSYLHIRFTLLKFDRVQLKSIIKFSAPMLMIIGCDCVCRSFGVFYIGSVHGTLAVTILSLAIQLRGYAEMFVRSLSSFFLPQLSFGAAKNMASKEVSDLFKKVSRLEMHIGLFFITVFAVFGIPFLKYWAPGVDSGYVYCAALIILCPLIISMSESIGEEIVKAYNQQFSQMIVFFIRTAIVVSVTLIFSRDYSFWACAIAIGASVILCDIIMMNVFYERKLGIDITGFLLSLIVPFIICGSYIVLSRMLPYNTIIQVVLFILLFAPLYYWLCVNKEEKTIVLNYSKLIYEKIKNYLRRNQNVC